MRFTLAGIVALVATATAIPLMESEGSKAGQITAVSETSQQCGSKIQACCSTVNVYTGNKYDKRDDIEKILDFLEEVVGLFGDKQCYRNDGTICSGTVTCCSGGKCELPSPQENQNKDPNSGY
ncbi:hypothetical protein N7486_006863 [Penicillium sp. IBT 16267x]|nr:hypothetical protein N7486_006863 [Penicillium sp. IBT 16267x]